MCGKVTERWIYLLRASRERNKHTIFGGRHVLKGMWTTHNGIRNLEKKKLAYHHILHRLERNLNKIASRTEKSGREFLYECVSVRERNSKSVLLLSFWDEKYCWLCCVIYVPIHHHSVLYSFPNIAVVSVVVSCNPILPQWTWLLHS